MRRWDPEASASRPQGERPHRVSAAQPHSGVEVAARLVLCVVPVVDELAVYVDLLRSRIDTEWIATPDDEICELASVSKGSFYHLFNSKEELGLAVLEAFQARSERLMNGGPAPHVADPVDRASPWGHWAIDFLGTPSSLRGVFGRA